MDSGITNYHKTNLDNLSIHSEHQGPEEVTLGNGSKLSISHIGQGSLSISDKRILL